MALIVQDGDIFRAKAMLCLCALMLAALFAVACGSTSAPEPPTAVQPATPAPPATPQQPATPKPAPTPVPAATPAPVAENYLAVLRGSEFYVESDRGRTVIPVGNPETLVADLAKSGAISKAQQADYDRDGSLRMSLDDFESVLFRLVQNNGYEYLKDRYGISQDKVRYALSLDDGSQSAPEVKPTPVTAASSPTPEREENYILIEESLIEYYATFPDFVTHGDMRGIIEKSDKLMDYLLSEGAITREQRRKHARGAQIKVYLDEMGTALYKVWKTEGYSGIEDRYSIGRFGADRIMHFADKTRVDSAAAAPSPTPEREENYLLIRGNLIEWYATFPDLVAHGNAHSALKNPDEFMDYLLSEGAITRGLRRKHAQGDQIKVDLYEAGTALYKILESKGYEWINAVYSLNKGEVDYLTYFADKTRAESSVSGSIGESYAVLSSDGSLEAVITEGGITTSVRIDVENYADLLNSLYYQGEISEEQLQEYLGKNEVLLPLKSVVDVLDLEDSDEGFLERNFGIDRNEVEVLRDTILPLFSVE